MILEFLKDNFVRSRNSADDSGRIEFIDLAKGVCILLIVFFHSDVMTEVPSLRALRMPLYFVLAGLFFKDYGGFARFLLRKINRLVVPLCFFVFLGFIPVVLTGSESLWNVFLMPFVEPHIVNYPVWFLAGLFWVNVLYFTINNYFKSLIGKAVAVVVFGVAGAVMSYNHVYLPLFFGTGFNAMPFFFIGILMRKLPLLYHTRRDGLYLVAGLTGMAAALGYCVYYGTPFIEFKTNLHYGNILEIYVISVLMVVGLLLVCKAVRWLPVVSYFGRYSVIVLGLHAMYIVYVPKLGRRCFGYSMSAVEIFVLALLLSWVSIPLFRKYFPKFTAQDELIKPRTSRPAPEESEN
ncbi:MAG: acyltransferase [Muribaculaceae bacterium]|nr:acyltransferase [Muribaculaceae bacterium]